MIAALLAATAGAETRARCRRIRRYKRLQSQLYGYSVWSGGQRTVHLKRDRSLWSSGSDNDWDYGPAICRDGNYRGTTEPQWVTCVFCIHIHETGE